MNQQYKPTQLDVDEWNKTDPSIKINFLHTFSKIPSKDIAKVVNLNWKQLPEKFQHAWILANKQAFEEGFPCPEREGCFKL